MDNDLIQERLYHFLPAIYRELDMLGEGNSQGQLRALMNVLETQYRNVHLDIDALYDNWFIETADEWVIPYIAEQLGLTDLNNVPNPGVSQRRLVANTLAYRRRKGTLATLEHVIQDATGWGVQVAHKHSHHTAHSYLGYGDSVNESAVHHTQLDVLLWRLSGYPLTASPAKAIRKDAVTGRRLPPGCFTFDPLGHDVPLFNQPQQVTSISERTAPQHIAHRITRAAFAKDLALYRERYVDTAPAEWRTANQSQSNGEAHRIPSNSRFYGPDASILVMYTQTPPNARENEPGQEVAISPSQVMSADLTHWHLPEGDTELDEQVILAIDVELGRMMFKSHHKRLSVAVNFNYGFAGNLGAGPFTRSSAFKNPDPDWLQIEISKFDSGNERHRTGNKRQTAATAEQRDTAIIPTPSLPQGFTNSSQPLFVGTLHQALAEWENYAAHQEQASGLVRLLDNEVYREEVVIRLGKNNHLLIEAADGMRPVLSPNRTIRVISEDAGASLSLNGLALTSRLVIEGALRLDVSYCTFMPHGIEAHTRDNETLNIGINASIVGGLHLPSGSHLMVTNSIIDNANGHAISGVHSHDAGPITTLEHVTILGETHLSQIDSAVGTIFDGRLIVKNTSEGSIHFCYIREDSQTPTQDRCQIDSARQEPDASLSPTEPHSNLRPSFTSRHYGNPGYAQLAASCPIEIRRGAEDGSEMGAFHDLYCPQREDALNRALTEYVPLGFSTKIVYVS